MKRQTPDGLFYSNNNIWAKVDGNEVTMGVTEFVTKILSDDPPKLKGITLMETESEETKPEAEPFGVCKSETKSMNLINPLSYRLLDRNFEAIENPAIVGQDPYGAGWLVKVEMLEPAQLDDMFNPGQYIEYTSTYIPNGLYYSRNHIWLKVQEGDEVVMGLTDYGIKLLCLYPAITQIAQIEVESGSVSPDEPFGIIMSEIYSLQLLAPLHFDYMEDNPEVMENPAIINEDPYENGWILKGQMPTPSELSNLMTSEQYRGYLGE